jgi:hypothetical protein
VITALLEDYVQVAVLLRPDEHHRSNDGVDVSLERKPRIGQVRWGGPRDEEVNRRLPCRQEPWPVLKRLHRPPLDATGVIAGCVAGVRSQSRRDRQHCGREDN